MCPHLLRWGLACPELAVQSFRAAHLLFFWVMLTGRWCLAGPTSGGRSLQQEAGLWATVQGAGKLMAGFGRAVTGESNLRLSSPAAGPRCG